MSDVVRTILVPMDFSSFSEVAVQTGASFARKLGAKLVLLHVVDVHYYGNFKLKGDLNGGSLFQIVRKIAGEKFESLKQSSGFKEIDIQTKICNGRTYRTIIDESQKMSADLIVMGTHGHAGFDKLLFGSNTRRVVRLSKIPVLTVKEAVDIDRVKNMAFASSFNQEYTFSFPTLYQFMEMFNAQLHFLKIITPGNFEPTYYSRRIIEDFAKGFLIKDYAMHIVNAHSIEEGLDWFCSENKIDLLFMATHGRAGITHGFLESHTEKMGQKYFCPVFSIKMMKVKKTKGVIFPD